MRCNMKLAVNDYDTNQVGFFEGAQAGEFLDKVFKDDLDIETFLTEHRREYFLDVEVNKHDVLNKEFFSNVTNLGLHVDGTMDIYFLK